MKRFILVLFFIAMTLAQKKISDKVPVTVLIDEDLLTQEPVTKTTQTQTTKKVQGDKTIIVTTTITIKPTNSPTTTDGTILPSLPESIQTSLPTLPTIPTSIPQVNIKVEHYGTNWQQKLDWVRNKYKTMIKLNDTAWKNATKVHDLAQIAIGKLKKARKEMQTYNYDDELKQSKNSHLEFVQRWKTKKNTVDTIGSDLKKYRQQLADLKDKSFKSSQMMEMQINNAKINTLKSQINLNQKDYESQKMLENRLYSKFREYWEQYKSLKYKAEQQKSDLKNTDNQIQSLKRPLLKATYNKAYYSCAAHRYNLIYKNFKTLEQLNYKASYLNTAKHQKEVQEKCNYLGEEAKEQQKKEESIQIEMLQHNSQTKEHSLHCRFQEATHLQQEIWHEIHNGKYNTNAKKVIDGVKARFAKQRKLCDSNLVLQSIFESMLEEMYYQEEEFW